MEKTKEGEKKEAAAIEEIMKEKEEKEKAKAAEAREKEKEEAGGEGTVNVYSRAGAFVRSYAPFQSGGGKSYIKKAEEFAGKIGGSVRKG